MVKEYLNTLKKACGYTWAEISTLSGIPEATIKKIFTGETADPRFETIAKLVLSMGGNLNDIVDGNRKAKVEENSITILREICDKRLEDHKDYMETLKRDKKMLSVAVAVLGGVIALILILDILIGSHGWVRY